MTLEDDFVAGLGPAFLAHRLRRVSERLRDAVSDWLEEEGVAAPSRALSTLLLLKREGPAAVTQIASRLHLSHPLIIKLVARLEALGLTRTLADPQDARRRVIALTHAGVLEAERVEAAAVHLANAVHALSDEVGVDLGGLCDRLDEEEARQPFLDRLRAAAGKNVT